MKKLPKRKCFELLSNSLNLFFMECTEISLENLYVNIGAKRVKTFTKLR